ncbi:MAG: hypothetical protein R3C61_22045 [Bacteroidia bacterium]
MISKIFVDGQSFSIVAFDEHASGDRSWGLARLQKNATGFETTYTQDFATYRILLHYLPDNTLQVTTIAMYKDDAGINVNKYHFIRTDERGSSSSKK